MLIACFDEQGDIIRTSGGRDLIEACRHFGDSLKNAHEFTTQYSTDGR